MKTLLVSACLLGFACKYSGGDNALPEETLRALRARYRLIPVCPECAGGLPVPRTPGAVYGSGYSPFPARRSPHPSLPAYR